MKYLTLEDLETAKSNGIHEELAKDRFYHRKWTKQRAITQKVPDPLWTKYKKICEQHGVTRCAFYQRLRKMTPEEAATTPLMDRLQNLKKRKGGRKRNLENYLEFLSEQDYKIAAEHGISKELADRRFYREGFSKERAITKKPQRLSRKNVIENKGRE